MWLNVVLVNTTNIFNIYSLFIIQLFALLLVLRNIFGLCWLKASDETGIIAKFVPYRGKWN
jgi:hypothetical protein